MLTRINASQDQIDMIYEKHLKFPVVNAKYSYDSEDELGFVLCYSIKGALIQFQVRKEQTTPMFFSIRPGGNTISYDVSYPDGKLLERLTEISNRVRDNFWKGGEI